MMVRPTQEPLPKTIADEAARWVAESFDGTLSPAQQAELDAWLSADPRHDRAFAEMQAVWAQMDQVARTPVLHADTPVPVHPLRSRPGRTRRRWAAAAIAASVALMVLGVTEDWATRLRADAATAVGERRIVSLPDGSNIHLDSQSAVTVDFGDRQRIVRLLKGEAAFTVARDAVRPFTVEAGGGSVTALGTRFLVHRDGELTRVLVTEHRVQVSYPEPDGSSVVLDEGYEISYGRETGLEPVRMANAYDAMAWTEGVLVFNNAPLADVVEEIGRYHRGYVKVVGGAQRLRVSGVFQIDDPMAAIEQLRQSLGLRSTSLTNRLVFIYG